MFWTSRLHLGILPQLNDLEILKVYFSFVYFSNFKYFRLENLLLSKKKMGLTSDAFQVEIQSPSYFSGYR